MNSRPLIKILNLQHEHWDWLTNHEQQLMNHESQDVDLNLSMRSAFGDHGWADTPSNTLDELLTIH